MIKWITIPASLYLHSNLFVAGLIMGALFDEQIPLCKINQKITKIWNSLCKEIFLAAALMFGYCGLALPAFTATVTLYCSTNIGHYISHLSN